mgnify:FL=1
MGGKTSTASKRKYNSANYEYIQVVVPKGNKDVVKGAAAQAGESVNAYILEAVRRRMVQDGYTAEQARQTEQAAQKD